MPSLCCSHCSVRSATSEIGMYIRVTSTEKSETSEWRSAFISDLLRVRAPEISMWRRTRRKSDSRFTGLVEVCSAIVVVSEWYCFAAVSSALIAENICHCDEILYAWPPPHPRNRTPRRSQTISIGRARICG